MGITIKSFEWKEKNSDRAVLKVHSIRIEFLSRINQIYYWELFCTTHEHYNYIQLKWLIKIGNVYTKDN